jgi:hypothetical protein
MLEPLKVNVLNNLLYYRRKHYVTMFGLFVIFVLLNFIGGAWQRFSSGDNFEAITIILNSFLKMGYWTAPILCAFFIYTYHTKKYLKMVFTKPCSPERWLFSAIFSALFVSGIIYLFTVVLGVILFTAFRVPIQLGFFYIVLYKFFSIIIMVSFTAFLVTVFTKSGLAIVFFMFIGERQFHSLRDNMNSSIVQDAMQGVGKLFFVGIYHLSNFLYAILPLRTPYSDEIKAVFVSYRVLPVYWSYLLLMILYALVAFGVYFILSVFLLKKRNYI